MNDYTLQDWVVVPATPFQATDEQVDDLNKIIAQLSDWAVKNSLPCVLLTGKGCVPGQSYSMHGYSHLVDMGKVPAELLIAHVMATVGIESGLEHMEAIIQANDCRANVLLKVVKSDE
jgi:hypothetical protein